MIEVPARVKEALGDGDYLKNYRFIILNDNGTEDFTIDNNNLVKESVNFDERLCSEDTIKFGLCEGSHLQFQYFGFPDITGRRIQAYIDVQYKEADNTLQWYSIPMGFFEVKECPVQLSTGIRKCACYNKLNSEYLDAKADDLVKELVTNGECGVADRISMYTLLNRLLHGYSIEEEVVEELEFNAGIPVRSYNAESIVSVEKDGTSNGGYWQIYTAGGYIVPKGFSENEFFDFEIYAKQIYQKLKEKGLILSSRYTMANGKVYSLEEFSKTSFISARYVGGYGRIVSTTGMELFEIEFAKAEEEKVKTGYLTNIRSGIYISIPVKIVYGTSKNPDFTDEITSEMQKLFDKFLDEVTLADCSHKILSSMEKYRLTLDALKEKTDITIRKLQSAVYETQCLYGRLSRETDLFSGVELNNAKILPAQTLYPDNNLFPGGTTIRAKRSTYQQLWVENDNTKKFRYLIISYKTVDEEGNEIEKKLQRTINTDGNTDYHMSDNWLFQNVIWTEEDIGKYATAMVEKMKNIRWFPFEMWCVGLPFIEVGDEIEIPTEQGTYTSYILQRQMKGIQSLSDSYINGTLNVF